MRRKEKEREGGERSRRGVCWEPSLEGGWNNCRPSKPLNWRLPQLQSSTSRAGGFKPGQEEPWGGRRRDGRTLTIGDLGSFPLAFRRLVGVLVRCQPPSVASWLNVWSRSLVVSGVGGHWQPVGR